MARYSGRAGAVYVSPDGVAAPVFVASLDHWTLDLKVDKIEVTSFQDANKTYVKGFKDTRGTMTGFWDDSEDTMFAGLDSAAPSVIYLYPSTNAPTKYWYGHGILDTSVDNNAKDAIKMSGEWAATDNWTRIH